MPSTRRPIGMRAITEQVVPRNAPGFLVEKEARAYGYGDWLSWEIGLIEAGRIAFLSFPLPVEGMAVFGPLIGVTVWPALLMLPVLLVLGKISTFRAPTATSLFLLSAFHWDLIEMPSDGYLGLLTRGLPITVLPAWALYWFWANQGQFRGSDRGRGAGLRRGGSIGAGAAGETTAPENLPSRRHRRVSAGGPAQAARPPA
jgi:hypothetical protein